jgi:hypothetical protein
MPLAQKFLTSTVLLCQIVTWLGNYYHTRGQRLFNFTFKFHLIQHAAFLARHLNPCRTWCYSGEDLMQRIKKIVESNARCRAKRHVVCSNAMETYARGLSCKIACP